MAQIVQALVPLVNEMPSQIDVRVDVTLLHCQACRLPLQPPVFVVNTTYICFRFELDFFVLSNLEIFFCVCGRSAHPDMSCVATTARAMTRCVMLPASTVVGWVPSFAHPRCCAPARTLVAIAMSCTISLMHTCVHAILHLVSARSPIVAS
jgi:hypothetical protein